MTESRDIYSISRLNSELRFIVEGSLPLIWVEGEISNLSTPRSGHLYFSLKDAQAQLRCAMFRMKRNLLRFAPGNGMRVLARVRVTLYEPRGDLQLIIEHMQPAGEGALQRAVEALRQRLSEEGLFAAERKRPLPFLPRRIGLLTSPSGAAVRDVISVLGRRNPAIEVIIYPIPVQGAGAAGQIIEQLQRAQRRADCDLLILTRGGGSLEDLMAFNDEQLARAIGDCRIPLISAIGHEIDNSISDLVADRRAPTPSAAAELAAPEQAQLRQRLSGLNDRLQRAMQQHVRALKQQISQQHQALQLHGPQAKLNLLRQRCDELERRQQQASDSKLAARRQQLAHLSHRLVRCHPRVRWQNQQQRLDALGHRLQRVSPIRHIAQAQRQLTHQQRALHRAIDASQQRQQQRLSALAHALQAVSPLATLARGFAVVRDEEGNILRSYRQVVEGDCLQVQLAEGGLTARVEKKRPPTASG